jgi:hypothetical protein
MEDPEYDNATKGKIWELLFRLLSIIKAKDCLSFLQSYTLDGTRGSLIPFRVQGTGGCKATLLAPPKSVKFPPNTYVSPESPWAVAFDATVTSSAESPTLLLSMKVTADAKSLLGKNTLEYVFGSPENMPPGYTQLKWSDGTTMSEGKQNLAEAWHFLSSREEASVRFADLGKRNEVPKQFPVEFIIISPRLHKDMSWKQGPLNASEQLVKVVTVDSLVQIVSRDIYSHFQWN